MDLFEKTIPSYRLLGVLDGIERMPTMYGGVEAIDSLYFVLLGLLAEDPSQVRKVYARFVCAEAGGSSNLGLTAYVADPLKLVALWHLIRLEVLQDEPVYCKTCNDRVEKERRLYAIPTCYRCLPPPAPLEVLEVEKEKS